MQKHVQINLVRFFPLLLFIFNIVSKFIFLTSQDICLDEPFSVYHAQFEPGTIIHQLKGYNNPPLFELLLHFWIKLFGISPASLRALPAIIAALCPVALYYFGKRNFSFGVAVTASLLLSCSSLLVFYAHDCRVYSLFLLLCIMSMFYFFKALGAEKRNIHFVMFLLFNTLLMYAHYFGIFILFFQLLFVIRYHRKILLTFVLAYMVILIIYLPQIYVLLGRFNVSVEKGTWVEPPNGIESLYNMLWSFSNEPVVTVICLILLFSGFVNFIIRKRSKVVVANNSLIFTWFLFSFFGMFVISYRVPIYISRYLVFALPAYYLSIGLCIENLFTKSTPKNIAFAFVVICFLLSMNPDPVKKRQIEPAMRVLKLVKDPSTLVIVMPGDFMTTFAYHFNKNYFSPVSDGREYFLTDSLLRSADIFTVDAGSGLGRIALGKYKKIICFTAGNEARRNNLIKTLSSTNKLIFNRAYNAYYTLHIFVTHMH